MRGTTSCAPMFDASNLTWRQTILSEISFKNGIFTAFLLVSCEKMHLSWFFMWDAFSQHLSPIPALVASDSCWDFGDSCWEKRIPHEKPWQMHIIHIYYNEGDYIYVYIYIYILTWIVNIISYCMLIQIGKPA